MFQDQWSVRVNFTQNYVFLLKLDAVRPGLKYAQNADTSLLVDALFKFL